VRAVPSSIIEPIWRQFEALIPPVIDDHPLGCHRPRIANRIVFDKLVQVLVLGAAYVKLADSTRDDVGGGATSARHRRFLTRGVTPSEPCVIQGPVVSPERILDNPTLDTRIWRL